MPPEIFGKSTQIYGFRACKSERKNHKLNELIKEYKTKNNRLNELYKLVLDRLFGKKAEKIEVVPDGQLSFFRGSAMIFLLKLRSR